MLIKCLYIANIIYITAWAKGFSGSQNQSPANPPASITSHTKQWKSPPWLLVKFNMQLLCN